MAAGLDLSWHGLGLGFFWFSSPAGRSSAALRSVQQTCLFGGKLLPESVKGTCPGKGLNLGMVQREESDCFETWAGLSNCLQIHLAW